jgi:triosephosphate isomerase
MCSDYSNDSYFEVGAQNVNDNDKGAYTGEVSAEMLESMDIPYCIVGHSERRAYYGETDATVARKVDQLLQHDIKPIVCCGEVLEEREAGKQFEVVKRQITDGLFHLDAEAFGHIIIAYEPVWAIGTGKTATPQQAQEIHAFIRGLIAEKYGKEVADNTSILYGGSCKPSNAKELFANPDVDGGLIGGASLQAEDFLNIALAF